MTHRRARSSFACARDHLTVTLCRPRQYGGAPNSRSAKSFDLYGIRFDGDPDLRRILMWDEFQDHAIGKSTVSRTILRMGTDPHDEVLERAKQHYTPRP